MSPSGTAMQRSRLASYLKSRAGCAFAGALLLLTTPACHTTPVTGRHSLNPFSLDSDIQLGREAYAQVLAENTLVESGPEHDEVVRAMGRLTKVADDPGFEWSVNLLDAPKTVNAFALPGGKMAVYSGILPVCQGEAGLAVVMGHEIGHVVARHGTERMTTSLGMNAVVSLLNLGDYASLAQMALNVATLPFGRQQESEADEIGLIYMARAGYDPREAVAFWERMEALGGSSVPEFLSTHPSHETRIRRLQAKLPEALEVWRRASEGGSK